MQTVQKKTVKKSTNSLKSKTLRYALALQGTQDGIWDWNLENNKIFYSDRWKNMLGLKKGQKFGNSPQKWFKRVHPHDLPQLLHLIDVHLEGKTDYFKAEYRIRSENGDYLWVLSRGRMTRNKHKKAIRFVGVQTNITDKKKIEERLVYDAFHDVLTGLPNRALFMDRLNQALLSRAPFALLYMDLDRFKEVNDTRGHTAGDELLVIMAKRLEKCKRKGDTVARLGGDEFTILLPNTSKITEIESIIKRILKEVSLPFHIEHHEIFSNISIGITLGSFLTYRRPEDVIRDADIALYRVKDKGKGGYEIFQKK